MVTAAKIRRAKKEHRCTERSYHTIRPGDLYLYAAGPPWADWNTSGKWWIIKACLRCAHEYSLHTPESQAFLSCSASHDSPNRGEVAARQPDPPG